MEKDNSNMKKPDKFSWKAITIPSFIILWLISFFIKAIKISISHQVINNKIAFLIGYSLPTVIFAIVIMYFIKYVYWAVDKTNIKPKTTFIILLIFATFLALA